jgi:hypothetical protein
MLTARLEGRLLWRDNLRYHGDEQLMAVMLELDGVNVPVIAMGDLAEKWEDLDIGALLSCEAEFVFETLADGITTSGQWQTHQAPVLIF